MRPPAPRLVDVEAEEVIEEIVTRRDLGEDPLHIRALLIAAGRRGLRFCRSPTRSRASSKVAGASTVNQGDAAGLANTRLRTLW